GKFDSNIGTVSFKVLPYVSINDLSVLEGNNSGGTTATFAITLGPPSPDTVSVHWQTLDGAALANFDYIPGSGTLTFAPGVQKQNLSIHVLSDRVFEPDEAFTVNLVNDPNTSLIGKNKGICTIVNDDFAIGVT